MTAYKLFKSYPDSKGLTNLYASSSQKETLARIAGVLVVDKRFKEYRFIVEELPDNGAALYCLGDFSRASNIRLEPRGGYIVLGMLA